MEKLSLLHEKIRNCLSCPLGQRDGVREDGSCFFHVPGEGPDRADIMIVGEAPGAEEERTGRPFIGKSGKVLTEILSAAGLSRDEIFITSVCKCRPPKNRTPLKKETAACLPWLWEQISLIRPRIILTVGNVPAQCLLGTKEGITTLRGSFYPLSLQGLCLTVRPLFHPAYLLRNPGKAPGSPWEKMLGDLTEVKRLLDSPTSIETPYER